MILLVIGSQVSDLKENRKYQFQVRAANIAGVGIPSLPSDTFLCEEWTIAVPGWSNPPQADVLISGGWAYVGFSNTCFEWQVLPMICK